MSWNLEDKSKSRFRQLHRIGIIYNPATVLIDFSYYNDEITTKKGNNNDTHKRMLYHQKIYIKHLSSSSNPQQISTKLIQRFPSYFSFTHHVPQHIHTILCRLIDKIIQHIPKYHPDSTTLGNIHHDIHHHPASKPMDDDDNCQMKCQYGDLNKVSEEELQKAKADMDIVFNRAHIRPNDDGYIYDKRVDFDEANMESSWD